MNILLLGDILGPSGRKAVIERLPGLIKQMNKYNEVIRTYFLPVCVILILSFSRIIPHPSNFTPILAVGIFSGFYLDNFF